MSKDNLEGQCCESHSLDGVGCKRMSREEINAEVDKSLGIIHYASIRAGMIERKFESNFPITYDILSGAYMGLQRIFR